MQLCVVARKDGRVTMDSGFMFDARREDGELVYARVNPVRVLEGFFDTPRIRNYAREVWLGDWVLDCDTGSIVLCNDWTTRFPNGVREVVVHG